MFKPVSQKIDFPASERRVLEFWKREKIFEASLENRKDAPVFVFFEGPPTANGTPHNGHVLTRVIKDLFPRYKTMRGFYAPRKAGWDTHGLPVEVEVEKALGIHGKEDIEKYGVEAFTRKCIESVFRYTDVWQDLTERIGFWIDLEEAYVTFHQQYVESVWWALSSLFEKGLLYQGHKVVWWWPQGGTALSSAEVGLGYKAVDDPSITVKFPVVGEENTYFLAWTTTPWTLPSNCALTVNQNLEYCYVTQGEETYILAKALMDSVLGEGTYKVTQTLSGKALLGMRYTPLFNYATPEDGDAYIVISADFVTTSTGTGVVHTAPAYGEDDQRAAKKHGVGMLQLVGPNGKFVPAATDFAGRFCKEADKDIIRHLKGQNLVYAQSTYRHDYPYCWRAENDPLIQIARPAWFIRTTEVIERVKENNQAVQWMPDHIKDGRFGDFLEKNVDWALSRERFWGTPLNIWTCEKCEHRYAPPSTDAILQRNPQAFDAFDASLKEDPTLSPHLKVHKPWIDQVTLPCDACDGTMHRVPEVIDCWFDAGCMPFAQWGWPHKNDEAFKGFWPADFISEAIDQTRGWFYALMMVSSLLFEDEPHPHPFRNCIVLGHVCDKNGKKESKSKGNYTPPDHILDINGADAMRWYFYSANPPQNNTRYSPEAVRQSQQEFLLKLHNVYSFFVIYANIDAFDPTTTPRRDPKDRNLLDRWILSELNLGIQEVTQRLDAYQLYEASQHIIGLTDALSNWYVRRSRNRFWSPNKDDDKWDAYHTLYEVLMELSKLIAPFVPFMSDEMYINLASVQSDALKSVHLCDWPEPNLNHIHTDLSEEMQAVRDIVRLGLATRAAEKIRVRQPIQSVEVILAHAQLEARIQPYTALIMDELNVKEVLFTQDAGNRVTFTVKPNYRALGPVFGNRMPLVRKAMDSADPLAIRQSLSQGEAFSLTLEDGDQVEITSDLVAVSAQAEEGFAASGGGVGTVIIDTTLTEHLIREGMAREITSRIQAMRKDADMEYTARILVVIETEDAVVAAIQDFQDSIASETLAVDVVCSPVEDSMGTCIDTQVGGHPTRIAIRTAPTT